MKNKIKLKDICTNTLNKISDLIKLKQIYDYENTYIFFNERIKDDEFRIAVVGEFSSGKSTFINALLGKDVLQHASTETTAVLTRIVNVSTNSKLCNTGLVKLRNGSNIKLDDIKELKQYTTTASDNYDVATEIECVEIYLPFIESKHKIVIVDTPGLNGVADGHREQTIEMIQRAHACIYLIQRRGLAESDIEFLNYLKNKQNNFIFIQNFIDELHELEGESVEAKLSEQKSILQTYVFNDGFAYSYQVCGISALKALVAVDKTISRLYADSSQDITDEQRVEIRRQSRFDEFLNILQTEFEDDNVDQIQYAGTAMALYKWIRALVEQLEYTEKEASEIYKTSQESHAVERLERIKEKLLLSIDRRQKDLLDLVKSSLEKIKKEEKQNIKKALDTCKQNYIQIVEGTNCKTDNERIKELEEMDDHLSKTLPKSVASIWKDNFENIEASIQAFYQFLIQRIQEYSGISEGEISKSEFVASVEVKNIQFQQEETEIEKACKALENAKKALSVTEQKLRQDRTELVNLSYEQQREQKALIDNDAAKEHAERVTYAKSKRPESVWKTRTRVRYEERRFLLFFKKTKRIEYDEDYKDDSAGQRWDAERANAMNGFAKRHDEIQKKLDETQRRKTAYESQIAQQERRTQEQQRMIQRRTEQLARLERDLELKKKYAIKEYIENLMKSLIDQISKYINVTNGTYSEKIDNIISDAEHHFSEAALKLFEEMIQQKLDWIESAKQEASPKLRNELQCMQATIQKLKAICRDMEVVIK
ncbi:MAG: hypothetical protein E7510_09400 [Ruminococcus sp.]|nr:hypothetical protein [Ruminococcus sp.]